LDVKCASNICEWRESFLIQTQKKEKPMPLLFKLNSVFGTIEGL
jgi:hypothetical protein